MKDYIEKALRTESTQSDTIRLCSECGRALHAALGMQDETGEIAKELKAFLWYRDRHWPDVRDNLKEEVGDLLWYTALLMDVIGIDFEEAMTRNLAKLRERYPDKFSAKDSANRDYAAEKDAADLAAEKPPSNVKGNGCDWGRGNWE